MRFDPSKSKACRKAPPSCGGVFYVRLRREHATPAWLTVHPPRATRQPVEPILTKAQLEKKTKELRAVRRGLRRLRSGP